MRESWVGRYEWVAKHQFPFSGLLLPPISTPRLLGHLLAIYTNLVTEGILIGEHLFDEVEEYWTTIGPMRDSDLTKRIEQHEVHLCC